MKKTLILVIFSVLMFFIVGNIFGDDIPGRTFQYGLSFSYRIYEEPGLMSEQGPMLKIGFEESTGDVLRAWIGIELGFGFVNYDGQTQGGTPVKIKSILNLLFNPEITIGPKIPLGTGRNSTTWNAYPFFGFGYRFLSDHLNKASGGYLRLSNYCYAPFGLRLQVDGKKYSIHIKGQYNLFLLGVQHSRLSDADPSLSDLKNDQSEGYGYEIEIEQIWHRGDFDWGIGLNFNFWEIGDSNVQPIYYGGGLYGFGMEPFNTTKEFGIKFFIAR